MRGAHAGEALGLGFHHRAEGVAAVGALLLQVEADCGQVFVADRLGQQVPKRGQVHLSRCGAGGCRFVASVDLRGLGLHCTA